MSEPTILLSRTDSIGDVVLTLPMAAALKQQLPSSRILFLARDYASPVAAACENIDGVIDDTAWQHQPFAVQRRLLRSLGVDSFVHVFPRPRLAWLALAAHIDLRVGTSRRPYHWVTCNRRVPLGRRGSDLHEAQLNLRLLAGLGVEAPWSAAEIAMNFGLTQLAPLAADLSTMIAPDRKNIILHPLSRGSAAEWGLERYAELIQSLPSTRYRVFVTGTQAERPQIAAALPIDGEHVVDLTGRTSLAQLMAFIASCDALVGASTGPLHLAAALGVTAIGLYASERPVHPARWAPLGPGAVVLEGSAAAGDARAQVASIPMRAVVDALEKSQAEAEG